MTAGKPFTYATRPLRPEAAAQLAQLQPGQRLKITQLVRVGMKTWPAHIQGTFRHVDSLATGLATDRVPQDDIIVAILHFIKDNGELSSIALDEHTAIEAQAGPGPALTIRQMVAPIGVPLP
jgi:hypothetical protein